MILISFSRQSPLGVRMWQFFHISYTSYLHGNAVAMRACPLATHCEKIVAPPLFLAFIKNPPHPQ